MKRIPLRPASGASPAWLATPLTVSEKRPTPLRAVFSDPAGPVEGSITKTREASRASATMWSRDSGLLSSSSALTRTTGSHAGSIPVSAIPRSANSIWTSPPFMSNTPGP